MRRGHLAAWLVVAGCLVGSGVAAQSLTPGPPGPFVVDARGGTSGIPSGIGLYPSIEDGASVPTRGFGFDVGAHVYLFSLGPARVGLGANLIQVWGSTTDANATLSTVAPQVSLNFGTADGWSYLSAGVGVARAHAGTSASSRAINAGGGARWFLNRHTGVAFDVRIHMIAADGDIMPATNAVSASVGLSLK